MGTRVKLTSDPALAQPHAAGSKVWLNQPCIHIELGPIFVRQVPHFGLHVAYARQLRAELATLDKQIEALDVETSGGRNVSDKALVSNLYIVGTTLAVQTVLAFQHLVLTLESLGPANTGTTDLNGRFSAVMRRLGNRLDLKTDHGYTALCEIQGMRDAIEHPTRENMYTVDTNAWDQVPLTWISSGRAAAAFDSALQLLTDIAAFARTVEGRRQRGPGAFLNVTRGVKALNPARKPRHKQPRP